MTRQTDSSEAVKNTAITYLAQIVSSSFMNAIYFLL